MIIIINGSLGVGKTTIAEQLHYKFEKSIHLDGDAVGAVHPFEIYSQARISHLYRTLALLVAFHRENGYSDFVINYIFESADSLQELCALLQPLDPCIHVYWLICDPTEQAQRIRRRNRVEADWEQERARELQRIQASAAQQGFIGKKIDTTGLTAAAAASVVWNDLVANAGKVTP